MRRVLDALAGIVNYLADWKLGLHWIRRKWRKVTIALLDEKRYLVGAGVAVAALGLATDIGASVDPAFYVVLGLVGPVVGIATALVLGFALGELLHELDDDEEESEWTEQVVVRSSMIEGPVLRTWILTVAAEAAALIAVAMWESTTFLFALAVIPIAMVSLTLPGGITDALSLLPSPRDGRPSALPNTREGRPSRSERRAKRRR